MAEATGRPGLAPRWTSSAKDGVGTALSPLSNVWFTLSHGILDEIYFPRVDQACTRDCGLIVTDGRAGGLFAEEKRDTLSQTHRVMDGTPAFTIRNTHPDRLFTIEKRIIADPWGDAMLQQISLSPAKGAPSLRVFVLLAPHLVNGGAHNSAWLGQFKGIDMLFASGDGSSLALASREGFRARSVGFVGVSDGWQCLKRDGALIAPFDTATDGNVALVAEIEASCLLAIGFGRKPEEAAFQARMSLQRGFAAAEQEYNARWQGWQHDLLKLDPPAQHQRHNFYRVSTAVLRAHESPSFPGGSIASLSIPWGASKGDDDLGGYHLVWPRDLVETAGALLACGALADARRTLDYLRATQEPDGHWPQNCWLDGSAYWSGLQLDETAFPILLVDLACRAGAIPAEEAGHYWPMIRAAAGFLLRNGPVTGQDRWEENAGYTPATLAVEIAALLIAAERAVLAGETDFATILRDTADAWNADIENWIYVTDTPATRAMGVAGYYVRIAPEGDHDLARTDAHGRIALRNRPAREADIAADALTGPDALALVRFGLRDANDPRILDTLKVIDHLTRVELPQGSVWHRYNDDGYGEHHDGRPFDGTGHGRAWPLLTGERAHYALCAGDLALARALCTTLENCASEGGLLPEQVWDADDIPAHELYRGKPSGSAMPLVWAHAEYVKLLRSLRDGAVFDMPPQTVQRYIKDRQAPCIADWRPVWRRSEMNPGRSLRIQLEAASIIRWTLDDWAHWQDCATQDFGAGLHIAMLDTTTLRPGDQVVFTWCLRDQPKTWAGKNFTVAIKASSAPS
jgi:glucoamylase